MGKHFGELAFIRGIVYYKLSPHELKPYAKCFSFGLPNFLTRAKDTVLYWLPPFVVGYMTYTTMENIHYQGTRKNPKDFLGEVPPAPPEEEEETGKKKKC